MDIFSAIGIAVIGGGGFLLLTALTNKILTGSLYKRCGSLERFFVQIST